MTHSQLANFSMISNCLQCRMPSKEQLVIDNLWSSISHPKIEKSDSTDAVFANIVAIHLQKSRKISNRLSTTSHAVSNDLISTRVYTSIVDLSAGSLRYAVTSSLCSRQSRQFVSCPLNRMLSLRMVCILICSKRLRPCHVSLSWRALTRLCWVNFDAGLDAELTLNGDHTLGIGTSLHDFETVRRCM